MIWCLWDICQEIKEGYEGQKLMANFALDDVGWKLISHS